MNNEDKPTRGSALEELEKEIDIVEIMRPTGENLRLAKYGMYFRASCIAAVMIYDRVYNPAFDSFYFYAVIASYEFAYYLLREQTEEQVHSEAMRCYYARSDKLAKRAEKLKRK